MYTIDNIKILRDSIQYLEKIHQLQILEICNNHHVQYTENSNGIFINMTLLNDSILAAISEYMNYIGLQQKQLDNIEAAKNKYKEEFYNKANATC